MPIKIEYKTEQEVRDIKMTGLVSYSAVIDETYRLLKEKNLVVKDTLFKPNANGDTLLGVFIISNIKKTDADLDACIVWSHSYHKAIRFQCNAGAIDAEGNIIIRDVTPDIRTRRPSKAADYQAEMFEEIRLEISFIESSFAKVATFKQDLSSVKADIGAASVSLGVLYVEQELLTTSQTSVIKDVILATDITNGWEMYKCFAEGLKDSHPKSYLTDHIKMFNFFEEIFSEPEKPEQKHLYLPNKSGKTVNQDIKEQYNYTSPLPSVTFL